MKKFIIIFSLITMVALPFRNVEANLESVAIQRFVVLNVAAACAVNIHILSIIGNQLNGNEALLLNGQVWAVFTIAIILAGLAQNQFVLFGSPAFEAETGQTADVPITDQQCEDLQDGDEFTFRGSDGVSIVSTLGLVLTGLTVLLAIVLNSAGIGFDNFDLTLFFLTITTLVASFFVGNTNGTDAEGGGGGGGCELQKTQDARAASPWALLLLGLMSSGLLLRWRRQGS